MQNGYPKEYNGGSYSFFKLYKIFILIKTPHHTIYDELELDASWRKKNTFLPVTYYIICDNFERWPRGEFWLGLKKAIQMFVIISSYGQVPYSLCSRSFVFWF